MNRITPEMVKEAYVKSKLTPRQGEWYQRDKDLGNCGCGLTAIACANPETKDEYLGLLDSNGEFDTIVKFIEDHFGYSQAYCDGFVNGYDCPTQVAWYVGHKTQTYQDQFNLGLGDGKKAALEIFREKYKEAVN